MFIFILLLPAFIILLDSPGSMNSVLRFFIDCHIADFHNVNHHIANFNNVNHQIANC
jgi:hypothetical protein